MKEFINRPENTVEEMLQGLTILSTDRIAFMDVTILTDLPGETDETHGSYEKTHPKHN